MGGLVSLELIGGRQVEFIFVNTILLRAEQKGLQAHISLI
jgi:hypothetical protein